MGVLMSDSISVLMGTVLYFPSPASFFTVSKSGFIVILTIPFLLSGIKKRPDRNFDFCQGRIHAIRGATLIYGYCRTLVRILSYPSATDVCAHVTDTRQMKTNAFDHALRGPFDGLFSACISASQALCESIATVISASTVYKGYCSTGRGECQEGRT